MRTWPQSSQASTWPPRAAVRQVSIAAITLSWPRLRCPAWARARRLHGDGRCPRPPAPGGPPPPCHPSGRASSSGASQIRSSGLMTVRIVVVATRA